MRLRTKILLTVFGIVIFLGLLMVSGTSQVIERALNSQVADKELSLVQVVAEDIANPLLDGDVLVVQRMLEAVVNMNPNNIYAFVTGLPSGMLIHTFPKGFPAGLININPVPPGERSSMRILDSEQGLIRDVGYRILDGLDAELHIGFSQQEVRQATGNLARTVILLMLIGMLTALAVALLLSRRILKPLEKLTLSLRRLGEGYLGETIKVAGNDELGELAVCFNQMSSRLKESIDSLRTSEANYRLLLNKIMTAQESERQRIARELHDETSQSLSALLVGLKTAATMAGQKEEGVENILEELKDGVNQALKELHRIIYDLRPSLLDDLGLIPALRWYLETKLKPTGICLNFNIGGNPGRLQAEIEIAIFRITQEAVTNIIKYASARQVAVELLFLPEEIKLQVKDDGCGFDMEAVMNPRNARRPLGILGMKERARLLGGDLEVRTAVGQGTEINVTLPVSKEEGYNGHQGFDC